MAVVTYSQVLAPSLDTAVASAALNALANNGQVAGLTINNTPTPGSVLSYDLADLIIVLGSAVATSGTPSISVLVLPMIDGVNFPTPPGAGATFGQAFLTYSFYQMPGNPTTVLIGTNIPIPPYNFRINLQNSLGVAFPATGNTCQLQRKTLASW